MQAKQSLLEVYDQIKSDYETPVHITKSINHRVDLLTDQITSYLGSKYTTGSDPFQEEQIRRPFFQVLTQVRDVESRATSIKRKNIDGYAVDEDYVFSLVVEKELQEEFDTLKIENFLKDFQESKITYGTALVLVSDIDNKIGYEIEVLDFANAFVDPFDIDKGKKMFPHYMDFIELEERKGVWNEESINDLIYKAEEEGEHRVQVHHIEGVMKESQIIEGGDDEYKWYEVYVGEDNGDVSYLYHTELEERRVYSFHREARPGNKSGQGIGALEEVLEEQIWINDIAISMHEAIAMASKVLVKTTSEGQESVRLLQNGEVIELDKDEMYEPFTFDMPQVNWTLFIDSWFQNLGRKSSVVAGITGEEQKAGTPYAGQALQSKQASSIFDYRRERDGQDIIWLIENVITPRMVRRLSSEHTLNASFSLSQKQLIDNTVVQEGLIQYVRDNLAGITPEKLEKKRVELTEKQSQKGDRRSVSVPKGYITLERINKKMRWNVTSDTDDVQTQINNLVAQMSGLAPDDPSRMIYQKQIQELSGQSPAQFSAMTAGNVKPPKAESNLEGQLDAVTAEAQE